MLFNINYNRLINTNRLTAQNIENYREFEVKSHSSGFSTDMAANAKNAMMTVSSLLGNQSESDHSLTQSAVADNINLNIKTGEIPTALSRETENANQKVKQFDIQAIKQEVAENQEMAKVAGEIAAKAAGDIAQRLNWKDGSVEKIALHAVAGYLAGKAAGTNATVAAAAGAASEWLNIEVAAYLDKNYPNLNQEQKNALQQASAMVLGAAIGATVGGSKADIAQGALSAFSAERFNRQLHPTEVQRIKALAAGDKEKERRLLIAACALVRCSAQLSTTNPIYEEVHRIENLGNTEEYASERILLSNQKLLFRDSWGGGISQPLFNYNEIYRVKDKAEAVDEKYAITIRTGGALQAVGGAATAVAGYGGATLACTTGIGCIPAAMGGTALATYGLDNLYAGTNTLIDGKKHRTWGADVISQVFGISAESAELIYSSPSMLFGARLSYQGSKVIGNSLSNEAKLFSDSTKYVVGELGKDLKALGNYINDATGRVGVNMQNSQVLTNINNAIPKEYKVAFGINAITGGAVESLYYIDGSKNITKDNLAGSIIKVGTNATYDSLVHKLNPVYGVMTDTVKGIAVDNNNIEKSILNAGKSASSSSVIDYTGSKIGLNDISTKGISSSYNKYLDYLDDKKEQRKEEVK